MAHRRRPDRLGNGRIKDLLTRITWFTQRMLYGYSYGDIYNTSGFITDKIASIIDSYVDYQCEFGKYVPEDLIEDPAEWLNVLRKIQRAFELQKEGISNEESKEGFLLFGKYYNHLID